jgi:hypothetical protein
MEQYEARVRSEAREAAASSVRRIQLDGALRIARLEEGYAREFEASVARARRATRRLTSGFSIAFLVGASSLLASVVEVPSLMPDVALQDGRQYEVAGLHVAVSGAEAESEPGVAPIGSAAPQPSARRPKTTARSAKPVGAGTEGTCTGDPYDPLNFCL